MSLLEKITGTLGDIASASVKAATEPAAQAEDGAGLAEKPADAASAGDAPHAEGMGMQGILVKCVETAVSLLSTTDGFLGDKMLRISLPPGIRRAKRVLRVLGQDKLVDDVEVSMNRAAEKAVGQAISVFTKVLSEMSLPDALAILRGDSTAGTAFLRKRSETDLRSRFRPIIEEATESAGAPAALRQATKAAEKEKDIASGDSDTNSDAAGRPAGEEKAEGASSGGIMSKLATAVTWATGLNEFDLNDYVTDKAIEGLFTKLAEAESKMRTEPLAAASGIASRVLSAAKDAAIPQSRG